jgi:hypothetical protein
MVGKEKAHVDLNPDGSYFWNNKHVYPYWVSICLVLQLFVITGAMWFMGRRGLRVMRWNENERLEALELAFPPEVIVEWELLGEAQTLENITGNFTGSSTSVRGHENATELELQSILGSRSYFGGADFRR